MTLRPWSAACDYAGLNRSSAPQVEGGDAAASTATSYTLSVGDQFNGTYASSTDSDWVRVQLVAGQTYIFTLVSGTIDTYLYLRNASGGVITEDDDSAGDLNSRIVFTATTTDTYYLEASQFPGSSLAGPGSYTLTVASVAPTGILWTASQMADQLINGYWQTDGLAARAFDVASGGTITVNLNALTAQMQTLALRALQAWTDTTGLQFVQTSEGAQIEFVQNQSGAFATSITDASGNILSSSVNIDQEWLNTAGTTFDSYTFQTYIHEIGHAIGLGHSGNYNGDAIYGSDNIAVNDSWQLTVMSYFDQNENITINGTKAFTITPMLADLVAIEQIYGPISVRSGNTTYGESGDAGQVYAMFSQFNTDGDQAATVTMTVIDSGGVDTFDFRSDTANQRLNLQSGAVSDVYGDTGTLVIAEGTVIENLMAGAGNDRLTGNAVANSIWGNAGNDTLIGNEGNDSLYGGDGTDTLNGGTGDDFLFGGTSEGDLRDVAFGGDGNDSIDGGWGNDDLSGGNGNDTVLGDFGSDTVVGNDGNDLIGGGAGSDLMFGNAGNDTLNGGFGYDRMNGGTGADSFFHAGVAGHASDWIQDYNAAEGDVLVVGLAGATRAQFQINTNFTPSAGAAGVAESFIVYRPTGQIFWALVDGDAQSSINVNIGGQVFDLMA